MADAIGTYECRLTLAYVQWRIQKSGRNKPTASSALFLMCIM